MNRTAHFLSAIWKSSSLPGVFALLAVFALQLSGLPALDGIAHQIFDAYVRAEPRPYQPVAVRVVDIDEESVRQFGQWPWPRTQVGRLLQELHSAGASVIALDIVFSEADRTSPPNIAARMRQEKGDRSIIATLERLPDTDRQFADEIGKMPVVAGYFLTNDPLRSSAVPTVGIAVSGSDPSAALPAYSNAILPLPLIGQAASGSGFLTIGGDSDGITRKAPLLASQNGEILPSLSLEALRVAQGAGAILIKSSDGSGSFSGGGPSDIVALKVGKLEIPTTHSGELWMYYTPPRAERVVPAWKILSGTMSPQEMKRRFGGAIVYVGAGAIGLRDLISTPIRDRELGVMVHAQATEQMLLGQFLARPDWASGLERTLLLVLGLGLLLALPVLGATRGAAMGLVLAVGSAAGSWYAFHRFHFLLDPTYPVLGVVAVYISVTVLTYYREERQRSYIHHAFDRYLSPELVRRIAADPHQLELGGEERQMTVLFCDIRSFSRMSEKLAPNEIIRFLIGFLTPMCDILLDRKATIDKFIGDAILAFWNAPLDDADQYGNAARAALAMTDRLKQLNAEMPAMSGQPWPGEIAIGIGINAGPCCVGNMGSAQRLSYSLIGDTVNLASRIEGLTKLYGVEIAIGSHLSEQLPDFARLVIDRVRVVGRDTPEEISALIGDEQLALTPRFLSFAERHAAMLAAYRAQDWANAGKLLNEAAEDAPGFGFGKVYAIYRERLIALAQSPPQQDWDGVYDATEK